MAALKFYPLTVKEIRPETADCVSVLLDVPGDLQGIFRFAAGQYLTFRLHVGGAELRRSYSICSSPRDGELRVAIKKVDEGKFSGYAHGTLKAGDVIDVMPPLGKFTPHKYSKEAKQYLAIAAGSGITPIMSIMKAVLEEEPNSNFTLIYGNRNRNTIIFREAIEALKNKHMQRLCVYHVLSREQMDAPMFNGRVTGKKSSEFFHALIDVHALDETFICGPEDMILSIRKVMTDMGVPATDIHMELFTSPDQPTASHREWASSHSQATGPMSKVSVTLDSVTFDMDLGYNGDSILDAALKHGADLPYACKGGVCATCRALVTEGAVDMEVNYSLEPGEVAKGYVLTCQSHPKTTRVVVDFDAR